MIALSNSAPFISMEIILSFNIASLIAPWAVCNADIASLKELYLRAFNLAKKLAQSPSVEKALKAKLGS